MLPANVILHDDCRILSVVVLAWIHWAVIQPVCNAAAEYVNNAFLNVVPMHTSFHCLDCSLSPMYSCVVITSQHMLCCFLGSTQTALICILVPHCFESEGDWKKVIATLCNIYFSSGYQYSYRETFPRNGFNRVIVPFEFVLQILYIPWFSVGLIYACLVSVTSNADNPRGDNHKPIESTVMINRVVISSLCWRSLPSPLLLSFESIKAVIVKYWIRSVCRCCC